MSTATAKGIVAAYDQGGQLPPMEAMTRYMIGKYVALTEAGQSAEANQMAFEVVQRMQLEAAKFGTRAAQQLRQGNIKGAQQSLAVGHQWTPDGKQVQFSNDGSSYVVVDSVTGKQTTQEFVVKPEDLLKMAYGLASGTMWNQLLARAHMVKGASSDPKKAVDLENALKKGQLYDQSLEKNRRKLNAPVGGGGASSDMSLFRKIRDGKAGEGQPSPSVTIINQGSNEDDAQERALLQDDNQ